MFHKLKKSTYLDRNEKATGRAIRLQLFTGVTTICLSKLFLTLFLAKFLYLPDICRRVKLFLFLTLCVKTECEKTIINLSHSIFFALIGDLSSILKGFESVVTVKAVFINLNPAGLC